MKLVYVSDAIYPYNKGGKEKRLYELTTRLAAMGHDVHVYTMHWWKTPEKTRIEQGVTLHAISKYYPMYSGDKRSIKEGLLFGLACFKLLRVRFDVVDVDHMPFFPIFSAWIVCKLKGKKLYGTWHEALTLQDWTNYMGTAGYIAAAIERLSIKLPHSITATCEQTAQLLGTYHGRTHRVSLVACGIDAKLIESIKPVESPCDVLYVGRLVKDKNVDKLISAFAIVLKKSPQAQCVIIGHGVEKSNIQKLVKTLGLANNVTILNPLPDARDVYAYMKRAKVFVLPSVREGFGIVVLEALACGTPVVTVDAPANSAKQLISKSQTGNVVPLEPTAIAEAISSWLQRTDIHWPISISEYDWYRLATRQVEVYA